MIEEFGGAGDRAAKLSEVASIGGKVVTRALGDACAAKRDFWLCLARAFAPPAGGEFHTAFTSDLPSDLEAIAEEIGLNVAADLDRFREAAGGLTDALEIQQHYASFFVTPPVPVFMNTGVYLDNAFLGPSEIDINDWYARHGFERHAGFKDLNDHVAVQFEFVGLLYEKAADRAFGGNDMEALAFAAEAERFLAAFPRRWVTSFLSAIEGACSERRLNRAYAHLSRIAWLSIEHHLAGAEVKINAAESVPFPAGSSRGMGALTAEDLAEIAFRLDAAGLSYDHVKALPEWEDAAFNRRSKSGGSGPQLMNGAAS